MDQDQIRRCPFCGGQTEPSDLSICPHCGARADEPVGSDLEEPEDPELAAEGADSGGWSGAQPGDDTVFEEEEEEEEEGEEDTSGWSAYQPETYPPAAEDRQEKKGWLGVPADEWRTTLPIVLALVGACCICSLSLIAATAGLHGVGVFRMRTETPMPTETLLPTDTPPPLPTETPLPTDTPPAAPTDTPVPPDTPVPTPTEPAVPPDTPEPPDTPVPPDTAIPTPTETPAPLPTPTPTVEPEEPDEPDELGAILGDYSRLGRELGNLVLRAGQNPGLLQDDEWQAEVDAVLLKLREANDAMRTLLGSLFRRG